METIATAARKSAVGCKELEKRGLVEFSGCCEVCHSAEKHGFVVPLGPCRATLPDGGEVLVCCGARKQLPGTGVANI